MLIEVTGVGPGHSAMRKRYSGETERTWVRPVTLHCTEIECSSALQNAIDAMADADPPRRAAGGGWEIMLVVNVRNSWETEQVTGLRTAHELDAAYDQARLNHDDKHCGPVPEGSLLLRIWRRI